jgi:hypothetical protein
LCGIKTGKDTTINGEWRVENGEFGKKSLSIFNFQFSIKKSIIFAAIFLRI